MGFDFIVTVPLLLSHCGFSFVFGCSVSFLVSSSVFLSMIVQQLAVIPMLSQEGVGAHPSGPPSGASLLSIYLEPPDAGRGKERSSFKTLWREKIPADTLILDFWPPELHPQ